MSALAILTICLAAVSLAALAALTRLDDLHKALRHRRASARLWSAVWALVTLTGGSSLGLLFAVLPR